MLKLPPESLLPGKPQFYNPILIFNLGIQIVSCQGMWLAQILLNKLVRKARWKRKRLGAGKERDGSNMQNL